VSKKTAEALLLQEIAEAGFDQPEQQHKFHPTRRWKFDFAWPDRMIAVEVEGGAWIQGRHTRGQGFLNDCEKYNEAVCLGWSMIRIPTDWVGTGAIANYLDKIW